MGLTSVPVDEMSVEKVARKSWHGCCACIVIFGGGPETGAQKAFHGGGWMDSTTTMRVAMRNGTDPNTKINWMGFRCARDVQETAGTTVSLLVP